MNYLSTRTPKNGSPIHISSADALMGAPGIALPLGRAAQLTHIFNPLLGLIALNMTAAAIGIPAALLKSPLCDSPTGGLA